MGNEPILISLTDRAAEVLHAHGVTPDSYGTAYAGESAGLDLYNCGEETVVPGRTRWSVFGEPAVLISTGLKVEIPVGCVGLVKERGSIIETGLAVRGGVIDPGYTGEVFVNLVNIGERDTTVPAGAKLPLQMIVVRCFTGFEVISSLEFLDETSESKRGTGMVGSSDEVEPLSEGDEAGSL